MILRCATCHLPISQDVRELHDRSQTSTADASDFIPSGYYLVATGAEHLLEGEFVLNVHDMLNTTRHPDKRRLNGCCGLDGLDGINTICANGHEIGTERSDCWIPHYIHIPRANVESVAAQVV